MNVNEARIYIVILDIEAVINYYNKIVLVVFIFQDISNRSGMVNLNTPNMREDFLHTMQTLVVSIFFMKDLKDIVGYYKNIVLEIIDYSIIVLHSNKEHIEVEGYITETLVYSNFKSKRSENINIDSILDRYV